MDAVPLCEPWPVSGCGENWADGYDPAVTGVGAMAASELLWAASGRRFGSCSVTVRPCSRRCLEQPYGGWWWYPGRWQSGWPYGPTQGGWMAAVCGGCSGSCGCSSADELRLPVEAQAVTEVSVDGVVLPPSGYAFYDGLTLVRTDGALWPFCQDWTAASGVGVFEVTATFGRPVPPLGQLAMGEAVQEVLKACAGETCALPSGVVQTVSRQGVTKVFADASALATAGRTGLPLTDRFLDAENPSRLQSGARIWDPEEMGRERRPGGVG